jgi:hypothetical protein
MPLNSQKCNHARKFNSYMSAVNELWVSEVLGIPRNTTKGPDLITPEIFTEVKFALTHLSQNTTSNYPKAWTVLEHQTEYNKHHNSPGTWAFGLYELLNPISEIEIKDSEDFQERINRLENLVKTRTLYLTNWDFIYQFKPHKTKGKTELSQWENTLRYVKLKDIPETQQTYQVEKGLIHLTSNVPNSLFPKLKDL